MFTFLPALLQKRTVQISTKIIFLSACTLVLLAIPAKIRQYNRQNVQKTAVSLKSNFVPFANGLSPFIKKENKQTALSLQSKPVDTASLKQSDWFASVKKDLDKRLYNINACSGSKNYNSINAAQQLKTAFSDDGFTLYSIPKTLSKEDLLAKKIPLKNDWNLHVQVKGLYADGKLLKKNGNETTVNNDNNIAYNFGNAYTVQYHNDEKGVRQNFIIKQKPSKNTKELKVRLHANGNWVVNKVHDKELHFAKQNNFGGLDNKITYNDLKVWDANGKTLPAKMTVGNDNNFEIVADVTGAAYPVTIDPISTTPSTTLTNAGVANFGLSVASAGDINGDGYSDVIVGSNSGSVSIYLGSLSGLSSTAATTITGVGTFGTAVASAGDINKDGFSDVLIGDAAGNVFIFTGSATGITSGASTTATATITGTGRFGASVANAGDVNGDGYSDIIIGNAGGSAFIFSGSASGIASGTSAGATSTLTGAGPFFGTSVASAGDINADGFSDVIIGDAGGGAFVFSGSASGVASSNTSGAISLTGTGSFFGESVSSAGDVNGDGYSDVIVGNGFGNAFVFISNNSSITSGTTAVTLSGGTNFGFSVAAAGDVNGDAFSDVIVGDEAGNATIYYGSVTGLPTTAAVTLTGTNNFGNSVASAGDVNGDGYSDVIVGAATSTSAFTYVGSPTGAVSLPTVTINGINAGDQFGYSVSSAGDVNGDGYSDVIIGANGYVGGYPSLGAFFLYLGSSTGLLTTPAGGTPISGPTPSQGLPDDNFGLSVASAGDVNGDGYGDVMISGIGYNDGGVYSGIVVVYFGGPSGLNGNSQTLNSPGDISYAEFGYSVASAGDVNGDGYNDVIISAPTINLTVSGQGEAFIFLGSASGLVTLNPTVLTVVPAANSPYENYGWSVSSAGDVNGDGYSDVIVGGQHTNIAYIYLGSPTGIANNASPDITLDGGYGNFAYSVSSAGDINGDGYSDVIVGGPGIANTGVAALFLGSSSGTETTPSTTFFGLNSSDYFGVVVASAGDVNGDGYSDVIVKSSAGPVYVYQGSASGFPAQVYTTSANAVYTNGTVEPNPDTQLSDGGEFQNHVSIATAGDVNGDGYSDIVQGVFLNNSKAGNAYVYYGNNAVGHNGSNVLHLYETDLTNIIKQDNIHSNQFGLGLTVQSPFGNVSGRMVWEVVPNGVPFSGNPITNSVITSGQQTAYSTIAPGGTLYKNIVDKAVGKATKVRTRIQYASTAVTFGQVYSPWIYSQVYLTTGTSNVLPLNLLSLTATPLDQNIVLNWKTAQEQNTKSFIIEHSLDDVNFAPLDSVDAKGNTTTTSSYDYTHYHPSVGIHYYRLKEEDLGGHFTYSYIVHATILANGPQFSIYPNPTSDLLVITYSGINQSSVIRIIDGAGNVVKQYSFDPNGSQTTISLKGMAKGTYFVQMVNSGFAPKEVSVQ